MNNDFSYSNAQHGDWIHHTTTPKPQPDKFHLHVHNEYEIMYFVSGDCSYVLEDRHYKLKPHDLIILCTSQYHFIQIDSQKTPYERYSLLIDPFSDDIDNLHLLHDFEIINCVNIPFITNLFNRFDYYAANLDEADFRQIAVCLTKELLFNIKLARSDKQTPNPFFSPPIVTQILSYIEQNLFTVTDVKEIARANYISEAYLFQLFSTHLNISPHKYIAGKRLTAAQEMLRHGVRPTAVSLKCGYADYTTFFKSYVKHFGHQPSVDYFQIK